MVMKSGAATGYEGKHSEPHDATKKYQRFQVFDPQEVDMIVEGLKENLKPDLELMSKYHGAKNDPGEVQSWLLNRNQKELGWIYNRITPFIKNANVFWDFDLAATEQINFLEFGVSNNTGWHLDGFAPKTARRKLTFSIMLSDPDDYRGGAIELWYGADRISLPRVNKGEILIWPSFILNRIASVKRGPRRALVGWAFGKEPFK